MAELRGLMDRLKGVERECYAAAHAVARCQASVAAAEVVLPPRITARDLVATADQLEPTYVIRVWAEFEAALRSYRRHATGQYDRIGTANLIDWLAGVKQGRSISDDVCKDVHGVRAYRNFLVHERDDAKPPDLVPIDTARRRLNIFLQKLPERW